MVQREKKLILIYKRGYDLIYRFYQSFNVDLTGFGTSTVTGGDITRN